jgi:hypothetical protein
VCPSVVDDATLCVTPASVGSLTLEYQPVIAPLSNPKSRVPPSERLASEVTHGPASSPPSPASAPPPELDAPLELAVVPELAPELPVAVPELPDAVPDAVPELPEAVPLLPLELVLPVDPVPFELLLLEQATKRPRASALKEPVKSRTRV